MKTRFNSIEEVKIATDQEIVRFLNPNWDIRDFKNKRVIPINGYWFAFFIGLSDHRSYFLLPKFSYFNKIQYDIAREIAIRMNTIMSK
jgi:hypothetical protein